jgi:hypothetical protein
MSRRKRHSKIRVNLAMENHPSALLALKLRRHASPTLYWSILSDKSLDLTVERPITQGLKNAQPESSYLSIGRLSAVERLPRNSVHASERGATSAQPARSSQNRRRVSHSLGSNDPAFAPEAG